MASFWCSHIGQAVQAGQASEACLVHKEACQVDQEACQDDKEACQVDEEEEQTCAICFESQSFISLPCACKVHYCATCWDRCLANSAMVRGLPSCPSCRQSFTVDYNDAAGGLVFSTASENTARAGEWRKSLSNKVRPVQIQLLRDHGTSVSIGSRHAGQQAHACTGQVASSDHSLPRCVCGAHLELSCRRGRILRMLDDTDPDWRTRGGDIEGPLRRLLANALVTCDLCESLAMPPSAVWTCSNGPHTVLHPEGNDICEQCFERYVGHANPVSKLGCTSGCYCHTSMPTPTPPGSDVGVGCTVHI